MEAAKAAALKLFEGSKRIPVGLWSVGVANKQCIRLRLTKSASEWTRKETLLIRKTSKATKKLALFAIMQAPPIIGLPVIWLALQYPRHILTEHFWSPEQRREFMREEYLERQSGRRELVTCSAISRRSNGLSVDDFASTRMSISKLDEDTLMSLARAHAIFTIKWFEKITPTWMIKRMLHDRAVELAVDDKFFVVANVDKDGSADLSTKEDGETMPDGEELRQYVLDRGGNPDSDMDSMKRYLKIWLEVRNTKLAPSNSNDDGSVSLLHAALPHIADSRIPSDL
jgi:LETM1-like protein